MRQGRLLCAALRPFAGRLPIGRKRPIPVIGRGITRSPERTFTAAERRRFSANFASLNAAVAASMGGRSFKEVMNVPPHTRSVRNSQRSDIQSRQTLNWDAVQSEALGDVQEYIEQAVAEHGGVFKPVLPAEAVRDLPTSAGLRE